MERTFSALLPVLDRLESSVRRAADLAGDTPSEHAMHAAWLLHEAQSIINQVLDELQHNQNT